MTGKINSVESFGLVDGPGVRYVVFLQGCNMRCQYCHNPETWSTKGGTEMTAQELFDKAYRYRNYWEANGVVNGGITVSGGEPLLQMEFVLELFKIAKANNVHTALDTSGSLFKRKEPFFSQFKELMEVTDLVILDLKQMDTDKHKALTLFGNENILDMANFLSESGKDMWIRRVLVPNLTDDKDELNRLSNFIKNLKTVKKVEVLPYHSFGMAKWEELKIDYPLKDVKSPTTTEIMEAEKILGLTNN